MSATQTRMEQLGYLGVPSGVTTAPAGPLVLVPEQFEVPEPLLDVRAVAAGPSPERAAELRTRLIGYQADLAHSRGKSMGQLSTLRSRIREINRELAGNAAAKDVAGWLKARAKGTKGAFDPELMDAVFAAWLPGWSIRETTGLVRLTGAMIGLYDVGLESPRTDEGPWTYYAPGSSGGRRDWRHRLAQPLSDEPVGVPVVEEKEKGKKGKVRLDVAEPLPGTIYAVKTTSGEAKDGRAAIFLQPPVAIGVRAWEVQAPSGETTVVLDAPRRDRDDPVTSDAFWKWAAGQDLTKQAAAVAPLAEASIPRASSATGTKAMRRNYCQACFRDVAVYPGSGLVVAHNYRRPGFGYIVQNCGGADWQPYADSCEWLRPRIPHEAQRVTQFVHRIQEYRADRGTITVLVHARDERGRKVQETDAARKARFGDWQVTEVLVTPMHPQWVEVRDQVIQRLLGELRGAWQALIFYRAAVRVWHPGVDVSEIQVIEVDRQGKPAELEDGT